MHTDSVKAVVVLAWILAIGTVGLEFGVVSLAGWTILAALALGPPTVMVRLWGTPSRSMSERIRDSIR